ncbi:MAG: ABC-type Fe3+ transport system, periplasmic component [Paenibacillaceae bacterium]|jgi:hypothetical protein|nr:ABC-type Fe3+ transport system, periplasmic component [Paenibacillaceae bacterium]
MPYNVYWNNICLVTRAEEQYISRTLGDCHGAGVGFAVEYFGLGRASGLGERLKEEALSGRESGDIIVTTNGDIVQEQGYQPYFAGKFRMAGNLPEDRDFHGMPHIGEEWLPVRSGLEESNLFQAGSCFRPFIVIPLVLAVNLRAAAAAGLPEPESLEELLEDRWEGNFAFGGLHNSAGRTLARTIWWLYGRAAAERLVRLGRKLSMPAHAFSQVMTGAAAAAVVPAIFAGRGGNPDIKAVWPREGAVAIPSYAAVRHTVDSQAAIAFGRSILGEEHQRLLRDQAAVIPCHPGVSLPLWAGGEAGLRRLAYPDQKFFDRLDLSLFNALCAVGANPGLLPQG